MVRLMYSLLFYKHFITYTFIYVMGTSEETVKPHFKVLKERENSMGIYIFEKRKVKERQFQITEH